MPSEALQRWLLVDYAGYPYAPNSLMPDNGLANLAGALLADGREVEILDYGTVSVLRRMSAPELTRHLARAWDVMRRPARGLAGRCRQLSMLAELRRCERARQRLLRGLVESIAQDLLERVQRRGVQAVGFKLWNGDGIEGAVALAHRLRQAAPAVRIFAGGPQVDFFMERILDRFPCFDAVVYGEGEETIRHLAERGADAAAYAGIPNLLYLRDGHVCRTAETLVKDLDQLPRPAYHPDVYPAMVANEKIRIIVVDESRGCRNDCAFCIHPIKSHRHQRTKTVPRLVGEINDLAREYACRSFRFAGSCTPYSLLNAFAAEVVRQGLAVNYASFAHIRDYGTADFDLLRRSGCRALFFGIESGCQRVLDRMRKRIRKADIPETVRRVKAAGIFAVGSLIFPAPGDDAASERETLELLAAEKPDAVTLQAPVVAPRTDWFEAPDRYGIRLPHRDRYLDAAMVWKIKLVLPPSFWDPLPVWIDGRNYRQVLRKAMAFSRRLAALGIPTAISDETYLMSVKAGLDPVAFRDRILRAFFCGDADEVGALVADINATP